MVQVTGIEGLGKSLLDRQDEGFRKARRRNRRAQLVDMGLNLAVKLGDSIFAKKYENYLKQEPVKAAERLAKQNTTLRKNFDDIQTQATAKGLSVPDYLASQLEARYDDNYFSKFIPRWNEQTGGQPWLSPEEKTNFRRDIINQSLFGKDYAKADFNPDNATEGLYGNYLNAKRVLSAKPGEDFESSLDLFDAIKKANPNAKSMGDGIVRLITERGITRDDRRASSEAIIQSNSKTLRERNLALQLFNDGLGPSNSLDIARKAEAINKKIAKMPSRERSRTPQDTTVITDTGRKLVIKEDKVVSRTFDGRTLTTFEPNMSHAPTRNYIEKHGENRPFKTVKTVRNLLGDDVEIQSVNVNGVEIPIKTEIKKLAYNFDDLTDKRKAQFELFFSQGSNKISPETRQIVGGYMAPNVTGGADATLARNNAKSVILGFKVNSVVLGNLFKDAGLFSSVTNSNSDRTALAISMLSVDLGKGRDVVKLSDTDPLSKLLNVYNGSIMEGKIPTVTDYDGVTLNPFLVVEGLDRYIQGSVDANSPISTKNPQTKKAALVSELSDIFGGDLPSIRKSFERLPEEEKEYILDLAEESVDENINSLFMTKGIEGSVVVNDRAKKELADAGFVVDTGIVDATQVPLGFILLGEEFLDRIN